MKLCILCKPNSLLIMSTRLTASEGWQAIMSHMQNNFISTRTRKHHIIYRVVSPIYFKFFPLAQVTGLLWPVHNRQRYFYTIVFGSATEGSKENYTKMNSNLFSKTETGKKKKRGLFSSPGRGKKDRKAQLASIQYA